MLNKFTEEFKITSKGSIDRSGIDSNDLTCDVLGFKEFMSKFSGVTFCNGLYRIHNLDDLDKWTNIAVKAFPYLSRRIKCFGYDWLGRQFAIDYKRYEGREPMILMLEPGTGEVLEISTTFLAFHEEEIVEYKDAALAESFFEEWYQANNKTINHNQCVGYKIPLFLGGNDIIENLELIDMEVYWDINSQLFSRTGL